MATLASFSWFGRQAAKIGTGAGKASPCTTSLSPWTGTAITAVRPLSLGVDFAQAHRHKVFLPIPRAPLRALGLVPPPVKRADFGVLGFGLNLFDDLLAKQGDLSLGFGHKACESSPDGGAMRDRLKSYGLAPALVLLQQLAEFGVPKRAQGHGDSGQPQKG